LEAKAMPRGDEMDDRRMREQDLVLDPTQQIDNLDQTKGDVSTIVGPYKTSLSQTDQPVLFRNGSFDRVDQQHAVRQWPYAPKGHYMVLHNPSKDNDKEHPTVGISQRPQLLEGKKVNIPGPVTFPLWPGQVADVVEGHHLQLNQYLLVRVHDEEEARANWDQAVVQRQTEIPDTAESGSGGESTESEPGETASAETASDILSDEAQALTMGKLMVITGKDVSFYMPPTGVEVVKDDEGNYVRDAVTLERLEYCVLKDQSGTTRPVSGPDVVFPKPTEVFVRIGGNRKFKATELNQISGIYVKVIADYNEDGSSVEEDKDPSHKLGDELFLTGKECPVYFPRTEHAVVKYGGDSRGVHYAIAIPRGEGRYVLDRNEGNIDLVKGYAMFLPDPRKQVVVRRILTEKECGLFYPGNTAALQINARLRELAGGTGADFVEERVITDSARAKGAMRRARSVDVDDVTASGMRGASGPSGHAGATPQFMMALHDEAREAWADEEAVEGHAGPEVGRKEDYTPPREITLDTKYEGAVGVTVWTGYAVKVVNRIGDSKVVQGPAPLLLEYDETLEAMELSTGTPKNTDSLLSTVYLRVRNNRISDKVRAQTRDLCAVEIKLSYRVNFEGEPEKWFDAENYVKLLCDHCRSVLKNAIRGLGVEDFYGDAINIVRDTILGKSQETENGSKRKGMPFEENGMRIYDVEVLDVVVGDQSIASMLIDAQHSSVRQVLELAKHRRELEATTETEGIKRQIADEQFSTTSKLLEIQSQETAKRHVNNMAEEANAAAIQEEKGKQRTAETNLASALAEVRLADERKTKQLVEEFQQKDLERVIKQIDAETGAVKGRADAVSPQMIAALQTAAEQGLLGELSKNLNVLSILGDKSIQEVAGNLLGDGNGMGDLLKVGLGAAAGRFFSDRVQPPAEASQAETE